jgi:hydrogenase nickel incorporation protein HypB
VDAAIGFARRVNPGIHVIELSATSGEGMDEWLAFLRDGMTQASADRQRTVDGLKARIAHLEARLQQAQA